MTQKIFIGKISKGMEQFYLPFNIDNDAFPTLYNAYAWRGRIKRKRGTTTLGRLQIQEQIVPSGGAASWQLAAATLDGSGSINLISHYSLGSGATLVPLTLNVMVNGTHYTDTLGNGTLTGGSGGSINYATGVVTFTGQAGQTLNGTTGQVSFAFYPDLPVMGLRDLTLSGNSQYPGLLSFDTKYAYQILQVTNSSPSFYNVSYYKSTNNPVTWSGANYQQFWTTNYQGALWATNNNPAMQMGWVHACANQTGTTITMTLYNYADNAPLTNLQLNDWLFFNEGTAGTSWTLNGKCGYVSANGSASSGIYTITFSASQTVNGYNADTAIVQLLTNTSPGVTGDGIRWYDGDMTSGTGIPTSTTTGWVNFAPPLTATSTTIDDNSATTPWYLVGALAIVPFKDRLLFFAPYIQTSSGVKNGTAPILLNDSVIWSWNGTPYYTINANTTPGPAIAPAGQAAAKNAYYVDQTGYGGWLSSGLNQNIISVNNNEDVLLVGFTGKQTRFVYTSNDLYPFLFYIINSELGTSSTFATITLDRGALSFGQYGIILTSQVASQRIDLQIPNQVFQLAATSLNNAALRLSASRDYYHEWVHFTFFDANNAILNANPSVAFPNLTLQYNYREDSWGFQYENFTAHGYFRKNQGFTWASNPWNSSGTPWSGINDTWNSGVITSLFPSVVAGNPQGFVVIKNDGTGEAPTGAIQAISATSDGYTQITSNNHCVNNDSGPLGDGGDYLYFSGAIGSTYLNGKIGRVIRLIDANNFVVDILFQAGTYLGLGVYTRLSQPLIQTKQFPLYWNEGRKVRVGPQKYLLDYTDEGQVSLNIYLSQDPDNAYNAGSIVPSPESQNNSLVYSQVLYTCPESTNIGLTQFTESINNPNPISGNQYQIWHRVNTSLIGDTFQLGITLNDAQMRNLTYAISEIALHALQVDCGRGPMLT